ncbi:uncharacterized protein B0H18DRAFT_1122773 [Fomitopsis serialis]|uniref:uncharacterized protein n=1 Tax=Fomitopsis serialis TaxID=139415 RepID=UPI002007DBF0|nr:uncharacterized protein B0H18DRAFT_1122773 [Neoantrodia serialis]KAH9918967.1 hypothetical protein B0H18DRAFT_1122773 [Neoantrodia serialis]
MVLWVPIPWAALDGLESFTHSRNYFNDLARTPPPHPSFQHTGSPLFSDDAENLNPCETEVGDCHGDVALFEKTLANIANVEVSCIAEGSDGCGR